jgi:hypothetical protein
MQSAQGFQDCFKQRKPGLPNGALHYRFIVDSKNGSVRCKD